MTIPIVGPILAPVVGVLAPTPQAAATPPMNTLAMFLLKFGPLDGPKTASAQGVTS